MTFKSTYDSSLSRLIGQVEAFLATYLSSTYWIWKVIATCLVISVFQMILSNPSALWAYLQFWNSLRTGHEFDAYVTVKAQAATFYQDAGLSHFTLSHYDSAGHLHKMRFRLFLPWLVATFHIQQVGLTIYCLQLLLSSAFLWLVTSLTQQLCRDRVSTFLFVLSFSLLYPVRAAWLDFTAYGDFFAYFFLLLSIVTHRPFLIFVWLQLACWTDERAFVNSVHVLLWYGLQAYVEGNKYKFTSAQGAVVLSGLTYIVLRYYLSQLAHFSLIEQSYWTEFWSTYYENVKVVGFRFWSGFLGHWVLLVLAISLLVYERRYELALIFSSVVVLTLNLSFIVYDVNRAISYGYISIFIALALLRDRLTIIELRRLLLLVLVYLFLSPLPNRLRLPGGYTIM